jgi:hypothetical protein
MRILISPTFAKRAALVMFLTALVLSLVSFAVSLSMPDPQELAKRVVKIVHVDYERNIPTWFSASVLLLSSVLLAAISSTKRAAGDKYVARWWGLSAIFLILSLDETAGIHDRVNPLLTPVLLTSGSLKFFWVIPWSFFVLLFLLVYLRFFFALPRRVKWLFLGAGGLYVGGALGMEIVGWYMASEGVDKYWRQFETLTEESLEMMGAIVFFYALTGYLEASLVGRTNTQLQPSG